MKQNLLIQLLLYCLLCPVKSQNDTGLLKPERTYLHTDRNIYVAGEYLFYKMYLQADHEQRSKYAYLLLRDKSNSEVTHLRLEIINGISYGSLLLSDTLSTGMYQLLCYTNLMRNSEESIFSKEIVITNRFDSIPGLFADTYKKLEQDSSLNESFAILNSSGSIVIQPDKQVYSQGEKISISFELKNPAKEGVPDVSVSVSEFLPGVPFEQFISDYFGRRTEIIPSALAGKIQYNYMPEYEGSVLQGRVVDNTQPDSKSASFKNSRPGESNILFLSAADSISNLQYTTTDSLGSFCFLLNPYYEGKELFLRVKDKVDATIVTDEKEELKAPFIPTRGYHVAGLSDYLIRSGKIVRIQRFYDSKIVIDTQKVFHPSVAIPRVYSKSYLTILPSDYVELPDFIEIAREILPSFKVRKSHDTYVSDYTNLTNQSATGEEPSIFLDGVPVDDVNQIIKLGSKDIRKIESVPAIRYYGEMSFRGILSVFSKNNSLGNVQFKTPAIRYQSYLSQCFTKPEQFKPEQIPQHHPDLRQLLLWEPAYLFNGDKTQHLECFASDLKGKYRINVEGIMPDGSPVHGSAVITIK